MIKFSTNDWTGKKRSKIYPDLEAEQIFEKEIVIGELIDKSYDPLDLLNQKAEISAFELKDLKFYLLTLPNKALLGEELIKLLVATRPDFEFFTNQNEPRGYYKGKLTDLDGQGRGGILADWNIVFDKDDKESKRLTKLHKSHLNQHWDEFVNFHLKPFSEAISAWTENENEYHFKWAIDYKLADYDYVVDHLGEVIKRVSCNLHYNQIEKFLIKHFEHFEGELDGFDKKSILDPFFDEAQFINSLSKKKREKLVELGILDNNKILIDLKSEPQLIFKRNRAREYYDQQLDYLGDGILQFKHGLSWWRFRVEGVNTCQISKEVVVEENKALVPKLVWGKDKDDGKRFYLNSNLPDFLSDGIDPRANSLLGLLAVTYLSDDIRKSLPSELGLGKRKFKQQMREAQMPLLVSIYRNEILKSAIFDNVENLVEVSK